ncbi:MAG: mandelate racemase/muconate lactonizing enzyme family protein [Candidatus Rokubacteria bacterium]|nr:mandelate racemase/muconate lactonizing enzyme family protein [Candidatus Rokubacteria bacterium]
MKITDVEAIVLRHQATIQDIADGTQDALVVRVSTDDGITGIGEVDSSPHVVKAAIEAPKSHVLCSGLRELLIGENPLEIGRLWEKMYRGSIFFGRRGVGIHAMSGIDIALWDIAGKAFGKPVYQLLGGAYRDRVRAYASTLMPDTPAEAAREAEKWAAQGFTAVKMGWGGFGKSATNDVALVAAARKAIGDQVDLLLDIGFCWDAATAIEQVRRFEPFRPFWVEEPLPPDDLRGYRKLADAVDTRIACGEENATRWEFEQLMDEGGVDVVQPDIARAGGLTETKRIAEMAHLRGLPCVPHAWKTGILKSASLHLIASIPNALVLEFVVWDSPLAHELTRPRFWIDRAGMVAVPQEPGLGITLDESVLRRYRVA